MSEVTAEIVVAASPETLWPYLVDPSMMTRWMGTDARLLAETGGEYYVLAAGRHPARGEFLDVTPTSKVVFSFGWDEPDHPIPAGSTTVEISLTPVEHGTLVRLTHRGLPDDALNDHRGGWEHYLGRLALAADGGDPGPDVLSDD